MKTTQKLINIVIAGVSGTGAGLELGFTFAVITFCVILTTLILIDTV